MTYTYPPSLDHDGCCTDPTCRALGEWLDLIAADLNATGHHQPAEQVRAAKTDQDLTDAADHLDAIAGAADDPDLYDRLSVHARMLRRMAGIYDPPPAYPSIDDRTQLCDWSGEVYAP
ncbi:hypothetical protein ACQEVZ_24810 [Dactylosporangium sp. CA-152071]|uniref:hypothetical protein n=1 Tax=Dactylosporangium sp. CA-152071 TaxID=3239933 RepID=UPI003D93C887